MTRKTDPTDATVQLVIDRDRCCCVRCGSEVTDRDLWEGRGERWSIHHRLPRGAGGSRAEYINAPGNLVVLCGRGDTGCHGWVEDNRTEAIELGLLVKHGVQLPAEHPVWICNERYPDGEWLMLNNDGTTDEVHDLEVAA
jgi:hypothetical protein